MEARAHLQIEIGERPPLTIRRVDAIPVGLPLDKGVAMAGGTVSRAFNILVRIEAADGTVGWGEAASAPTMTGDTLGGLICAVRDHLAPLLIGEDAWMRPALCRRLAGALHSNGGATRTRCRVRPWPPSYPGPGPTPSAWPLPLDQAGYGWSRPVRLCATPLLPSHQFLLPSVPRCKHAQNRDQTDRVKRASCGHARSRESLGGRC